MVTQEQVADELGKPQSFVAKVERYKRQLDVIEFMRTFSILYVEPELLTTLIKPLGFDVAIFNQSGQNYMYCMHT